ncbi:MAG: hypothetical protein AB7F32_00760 [Victivallaceae bacterium]
MDIFRRFARSPDCLVAIDAADGGTWRSPFRPGVVYPSAVPRNFATEPVFWYQLQRVVNEAGAIDYKFEYEFELLETGSGKIPFYPSSMSGSFGYYIAAPTSYPVVILQTRSGVSNVGGYFSKPDHVGIYNIKTERINGVSRAFENDVQKYSVTELGANVPLFDTQAFRSEFGVIRKIVFTDMTNNKELFRYPTFEEETRLFTPLNLWTSNGILERAKSSGSYTDTNWYVKTPCFIHGSTKSLTMVARCFFFDGPAATWNYRSPIGDENMYIAFRNQTGNTNGGVSQGLFFYAYVRNAADTGDLSLSVTIADWATMSLYFNRWVVLSMVLDFDSFSYPVLRCYADGVLIGTANGNFNFLKKLASKSPTIPVCIGPQNLAAPAYKNGCEKVSHAFLFDRGLRTNEIQLLR